MRVDRPGLNLTISSNNWRYLLQHLRAEEIEFFIADARDIQPDPTITITPLCRQYGPFMCRAGHPLLAQAQRQPRAMLPYGFAALMLPVGVQAALRQLFELTPHDALPVALECDNIGLLADLARDSDVILMATEASVAAGIAAGHLVPLHFPSLPVFYAEISIVQLYGRSVSPAAAVVLDALRGVAAAAPSTAMFADGQYAAPFT